MTTGNAPTIEEQIAFKKVQIDCTFDQDVRVTRTAILASLEKLAAIESQPVPVEPFRRFRGVLKPVDRGMWVNGPCDYYHDAEVDTRIDSMQSALQRAQERIKYYEAITTGAEHSAIDKAMSAELLKEVEK